MPIHTLLLSANNYLVAERHQEYPCEDYEEITYDSALALLREPRQLEINADLLHRYSGTFRRLEFNNNNGSSSQILSDILQSPTIQTHLFFLLYTLREAYDVHARELLNSDPSLNLHHVTRDISPTTYTKILRSARAPERRTSENILLYAYIMAAAYFFDVPNLTSASRQQLAYQFAQPEQLQKTIPEIKQLIANTWDYFNLPHEMQSEVIDTVLREKHLLNIHSQIAQPHPHHQAANTTEHNPVSDSVRSTPKASVLIAYQHDQKTDLPTQFPTQRKNVGKKKPLQALQSLGRRLIQKTPFHLHHNQQRNDIAAPGIELPQ